MAGDCIGTCKGCGLNDADDPHPCPYQEDVNDQHEDACTCCADCAQECANDI